MPGISTRGAGRGPMSCKVEIPTRMNAAAILLDEHVARGHGDRPALLCPDRTVSYAELQALTCRTAALFQSLGVEIENRVVFCLPDGPEWVGCFFGAIRMGAVAVPLSTRLQGHEYIHILQDSRAKVLVVHSNMLSLLQPAIQASPYLKHVLVAGEPHPQYSSFERAVAATPYRVEAELMSRDDPAFWLYSSGTTGTPKGVIHMHHDCLCADYFARGVLHFRPDDVPFSTSKLFFAYALGNILFTPLRFGAACLLFPERPTPEAIMNYIRERRPTLFFSVPSFYAALLEVEQVPIDALESVRLCMSAGEGLAPAIYQRWMDRFGIPLLDGIGCSETIYTFISNRPDAVRPGSTGYVVPGFEVRLVDSEGRDVPPGETGALLVKAESCCAGYWNQEERTRKSLIGEWLRTGDLLSRDEENRFYYHGRADDMWKINGEWVAPAMVEQAVLSHPAVREAAVVGMPNHLGLIKPIAFVVPRQPAMATGELAAEILRHASAQLTPNRTPRAVEFVTELPRTATGKVQRFRLRELVATERGTEGCRSLLPGERNRFPCGAS
jgi:benzoate-CoA ligase family protein